MMDIERTTIRLSDQDRELLERLGGLTPAVREFCELVRQWERALARIFQHLTSEWNRLMGQSLHIAPPRKISVLAPYHWEGEEPAAMASLIEDWLGYLMDQPGLDQGQIYALWGQALGQALRLKYEDRMALGEFLRSWVWGVSCRFGNLDAKVEKLEAAFAEGLTGRPQGEVLILPEWALEPPRPIFPPKPELEGPFQEAWKRALSVLGMQGGGKTDGRG